MVSLIDVLDVRGLDVLVSVAGVMGEVTMAVVVCTVVTAYMTAVPVDAAGLVVLLAVEAYRS